MTGVNLIFPALEAERAVGFKTGLLVGALATAVVALGVAVALLVTNGSGYSRSTPKRVR